MADPAAWRRGTLAVVACLAVGCIAAALSPEAGPCPTVMEESAALTQLAAGRAMLSRARAADQAASGAYRQAGLRRLGMDSKKSLELVRALKEQDLAPWSGALGEAMAGVQRHLEDDDKVAVALLKLESESAQHPAASREHIASSLKPHATTMLRFGQRGRER